MMLDMAGEESRRLIVLASASASRQSMLRASGLAFEIDPADVPEEQIIRELSSGNASAGPAAVAAHLACAKAESVSRRRPDDLIIGADQVLSFAGEIFGKPQTRSRARAMLQRLRAGENTLYSSVVIAEAGVRTWQATTRADLRMWNFSDAFLDRYLDQSGESILNCAGAYQIEGTGARLFEWIRGDYFTILGLPLLELLAELRTRKVIAT